jgi:hypothetical protein
VVCENAELPTFQDEAKMANGGENCQQLSVEG